MRGTRFDAEVDAARERWRFLGEDRGAAPGRAPTARALRPCSATPGSRADLGPAFGPELTGAEVRYLMTKEWARFPDDILWRRSKLGLTMPPADREALAAFMARRRQAAPTILWATRCGAVEPRPIRR